MYYGATQSAGGFPEPTDNNPANHLQFPNHPTLAGSSPMKSVLIVDDHAVVRRTAGVLLTTPSHEFEVTGEAEDGQGAIHEAERLRPDLIVLDLSMPVMNGLEAAVTLRKMLPSVRLILFTSHDGPAVEQLARLAGIDAVVPKSQAAELLLVQAQRLFELP